jgi:hypothetical protein
VAWLIFVVAALIILVVTAFYLVGPSVLSSYDAKHKVQISCTVDQASSGAASARSSKGIGSSVPQVVFETKDCGTLILQDGVDRRSSARIAAEVKPGAVYVFTVGQGSIFLRGLLGFVGASPSIYEFHRG